MSTVEKWKPAHLWRSWDRDWQLAGQWDKQPPMSALVEGGGLTVDYPTGQRKYWRVLDGRLIDESQLLRPILAWPRPWTLDEGQRP